MQIKQDVGLDKYSTMRVGGKADNFVEVESEDELIEAVKWAKEHKQKIIMIGGGSNLIWSDRGYQGLVILNRIMGHKVISESDDAAIVQFGSGEDWDEMVERSVNKGFGGIEQLSWIPGRVGATPVQNVGAYGKEIAEVLLSVRAYDLKLDKFVELEKDECEFGYRTSRFKTTDKGRFLITSIKLKLSKHNAKPPFYESLQKWLEDNDVEEYSPQNIRKGVIEIRKKKLPDPDEVANNGSFFANPIIDQDTFNGLQKQFPDIVSWPAKQDKVKLSAGWLIEHAGFKDFHDKETGMATWDKQSLVLINEHAKSTADVLAFKQKIVDGVNKKFGITLEQEPELI